MTDPKAEREIRNLVAAWARSIEDDDMDGLLANHHADIVMFDVPPPLQSRGLDAYRAAWELFFSYQGKGTFDVSRLEITAGDDVAFCHGIVRCGPKVPTGQFDVRLTLGLRKIDGAWVVTHEHHSVPSG